MGIYGNYIDLGLVIYLIKEADEIASNKEMS